MSDPVPAFSAPRDPHLFRMANALRALAMDAVEQARSGHPGMPMGMADAATVLFTRFLRFDPEAPDWPDRDRFVLSAGHGSMLLYALLHLLGYRDMTLAELERFRQLGSRTAGHPERGLAAGIETTTGPLSQGLANAVGMALAERMLAAEFGEAIVDHRTYVIAGDGCLMEGLSHEALSLAGHLRLSRLIVLWDDNHVSIDGPTALAVSDDQIARFQACGWAAERVDGHDHAAVAAALARAQTSARPRPAPGLGREAGGSRAAAPRRVPAPPAGRIAVRPFGRNRRSRPRLSGRQGAACHAPGVGDLSRHPVPRRPRTRRRLGRSDRFEQYQGAGSEGRPTRRFCRPLYPLWRARTRHGGGDERHCRPWRADPLWRDVPGLLRLLPAGDPPGGADGARRHLCSDA